ncbi:hypothetical protein ACRWQL_00540 (plasmid) [Shewanella sp. HL-SH4]|uniref:hypothetical protein n=1 Tax=Shewanella TaxID=22 RepID=UPI003D7A6D7D
MQNIVIDNLIVVAMIKAIGNILTAAVPSIVTYWLGKKLLRVSKLQKKLNTALKDIQFLLLVEDHHCKEHLVFQKKSKKFTIRNQVKQETNFDWSGKNTLSSIDRAIASNDDLKPVIKDVPIRPARYYSKY